jgi:3-methyl-2-oxobutanoate hydroxymethyltransferase
MTHTLEKFRQSKAAGRKFASLTAYDYPLGRLLDGLDLDFILVGDSLGMVVLGHPDTTQVTLDHMVHHTRAVANGATQTLIVADLPAHTADNPETAVRNVKTLTAAGAGAVKLEGGVEMLPSIRAILAEDIPVLGHIGMLPQRVREEGGYRVKGKTPQQADQLKEDACALDEAGVFAMVLELVSPALAEEISHQVKSPTIGIGSGQGCDGQILVTYDLLGMFPWFKPRFVTPKANLAEQIQTAVREFVSETREPKAD